MSVVVSYATVADNDGEGMRVVSDGTGFVLQDSTIESNGDAGIVVEEGGTDIRLERLTVADNGGDGLTIEDGTELVLLKSTVTGNGRGLTIGTPRLVAAYSIITGNDGGSGVDQVRFQGDHPMLSGLPDEDCYYFVHAYRAVPARDDLVVGVADYGGELAAAVARERVISSISICSSFSHATRHSSRRTSCRRSTARRSRRRAKNSSRAMSTC